MPSGLIQLVKYGSQDLFFTGNPQISFFKTVYRRYTNFAIDTVKQNFQNIDTLNSMFGEYTTEKEEQEQEQQKLKWRSE